MIATNFTVLLLQPCRFQAEVWHSMFSSCKMVVIWQENFNNQKSIFDYFESLTLQPNLLIIDFKFDNNDEICQYFHQRYPLSPIILTVEPEQECLSSIRFCVKNQGIDEVLINFQQENLLSRMTTNINMVLRCLNRPPATPDNLVKALESIEQRLLASSVDNQRGKNENYNHISAFAPLQTEKVISSKEENKSAKVLNQIESKNIFPNIRWFLAIPLIIAILLEVNTKFISPVQRVQRQILGNTQKQQPRTPTEIITREQAPETPQGTFNYGGSTTWASIRKIINTQLAQEYPEFNLRYVTPISGTPGSGTGIRMLLEGQLDFAQSSRSIKPEEYILAKQRGFILKEYHIAIDAIAIAIHPSLEVSGLTIEQLQKIYLGQITNWKQVNGPDLEIVPFSRRPDDGGTPEFFQHHVLKDKSFGSNVKLVYSTTDGLRKLQNKPGGIYYASAPQIVSQCIVKTLPIASERGEKFIPPYLPPAVSPKDCPKRRNQVNVETIKNAIYPITRYLSVIVREDGTRAQKAGEAYVQLLFTEEMQQLIEEAGFVSIN